MFRAFLDTRTRLIGVEAGGRGDGLGDNAASLGLGSPGVLHGAFTMLDPDGRRAGRRAALGLARASTTRASARSWRRWPRPGGSRSTGPLTPMRSLRLHRLTRQAGILPALEPAHALAAVARLLPDLEPGSVVVVNLSGRGDKDLDIVDAVRDRVVSLPPGARRVRDAFVRAADDGRRPLIVYLMAGYPDRSRASRRRPRRWRPARTCWRSVCPSATRWRTGR